MSLARIPALEAGEATEDLAISSNPYLQRVVLVGSLGGLLFGLDSGIISTALISIGSHIGDAELTTGQQEVVVSITSFGALLASMVAGWLADWIGRKRVIQIAAVFFTLGAIEQSAAQVYKELVLGRLIVGLGVVSRLHFIAKTAHELSSGSG